MLNVLSLLPKPEKNVNQQIKEIHVIIYCFREIRKNVIIVFTGLSHYGV